MINCGKRELANYLVDRGEKGSIRNDEIKRSRKKKSPLRGRKKAHRDREGYFQKIKNNGLTEKISEELISRIECSAEDP